MKTLSPKAYLKAVGYDVLKAETKDNNTTLRDQRELILVVLLGPWSRNS